MDVMAYHLEARAPFHFGVRGVGLEATTVYGPSDTFFAGLCHTLRAHYGSKVLECFLSAYNTPEPPLVLSSAFPYVTARREEEVDGWSPPKPFDPQAAIRFYPRPLEPPPGVSDPPEKRKEIKKNRLALRGRFPRVGGQQRPGAALRFRAAVQGGRVWLTFQEHERVAGWRDDESDAIRLWASGDVPRVTVDRRANASAVYQAGRVWFQPGGGLWLLARWREDWQERGELALGSLGHAGVGGERSAGHGQYELHGPHRVAGLAAPSAGQRCLTLSLYYPRSTELDEALKGEDVSYRLRMRRGWMSSPDSTAPDPDGKRRQGRALRRKAVRMVAEGSILRWPAGGAAVGRLADVTPEVFEAHTVWRYGLAYAIGYRTGGGGA